MFFFFGVFFLNLFLFKTSFTALWNEQEESSFCVFFDELVSVLRKFLNVKFQMFFS